jgi:hypothetical protein
MRTRPATLFVLGLVAFGLVGILRHPLVAEPAPEDRDPLLTLNQAFRTAYAGNRKILLAKISPIVILNGDDLVLHRDGKRTEVKVIPAIYHDLKTMAHVPLGIYTLLAAVDGVPNQEQQTEIRSYRAVVQSARDSLERRWPEPKTLARQQEILDGSLKYIDQVLKTEKGPLPDLEAFCRRMAPPLLANTNEAARAEIDALHTQMTRWRGEWTKEEYNRLEVIVIGSQTPRRGNLAVQYFAHLLGLKGEGPRLTYAEALWEEPAALRLLGTRLVDKEVGRVFFEDDQRMFRDLLADAATEYLRTFKIEP